MDEMERRLGEGMEYTGGHPHGAREWILRGTRWYVDADAFDWSSKQDASGKGRVVIYVVSIGRKMLSVNAAVRSPPMRTTQQTRRKLGWLGVIYPGVSKTYVLHAIRGRLPLPKRAGNKWTWTSSGFVRVNHSQVYHTWTATLTFFKGRLDEIEVACERES
jgi:hypothetical protein